MSPSKSRGCAAALLFAALLLAGVPAAGQRTPAGGEAEPAPLTLRAVGLPDTVVTALYGDTTFFLPLLGIFGRLQVEATYDSASGRLGGHYIHAQSPYTLDFRALTATTRAGLTPIAPADFILTGEDAYISAPLLQRLFGITTRIDLAALTVSLSSPDTFPVTTAGRRDLSRKLRMGGQNVPAPAPLRYGRDRQLLNGLMLEYGLTGSFVSGGSFALTDLRAGGEVLGGDFQGALLGTMQGNTSSFTAGNAVWHYVLESPRRYLTQLRAGSINTVGLQGFPLHGVELTNEPVETRTILGEQAIAGMTHPDWEVELYVGDRLVGYTRADPTGRYNFDLPLAYGSSVVSIRSYGPTGGEEIERRRSDVPLTLVPAHKLDYWVNLGRNTLDRTGAGQARAAYGVSGRLTLLSGLEYLGPVGSREVVGYGGGTLRLLPNLLASTVLAPGTLNQTTLAYATPSQARVQLTYNDFLGASAYNTARMDRQLLADATLPLRGRRIGATFYGTGGLVRYLGAGTSLDVNVQSVINLGALKPTFAYRRSTLDRPEERTTLVDAFTSGFLYSFENPPLALVRGALVSATADYQFDQRRLTRIQGSVGRSVASNHRLSIGYDYAPLTRSGRLQLRYILDLQSVQSTTTLETGHPGAANLGQTVRGTTTFTPSSREWTFSGREGIDHSGAIFRFFVDADGDGVLDKGEEAFAGPRIRFDQATTMKALGSGRIRVSDLLPYYRYSVDVDQSNVLNPLWRPKYSRFSFVADPNAFKVIDVPFYAAGELQGTVLQGQGTGARAVPGLTVHIRRTDEPEQYDLVTFSDGSFYHPGVPPGTYTIAPDAAQLRMLRAVAVPASRTLVVPTTTEGATYSDLDFRLTPAN